MVSVRCRQVQSVLQCSRQWLLSSTRYSGFTSGQGRRLTVSVPDAPTQRKLNDEARQPAREYFYYVDHHGRLHLDDHDNESGRKKVFNMATCLKEKKFLNFFFKRLTCNTLDEGAKHLPTYAYVSRCGKELNFVRAEDTGIVFNRLEEDRLFYAADLSLPFQPDQLIISDDGRLYHPAPGVGLGLIASAVIATNFQERLELDEEGKFVLHLDDRVLTLPTKGRD